jgi:4-oxalmesaconate hydratase
VKDGQSVIDALPLSEVDRRKVFEGNARRVFPRLNGHIRLLEQTNDK